MATHFHGTSENKDDEKLNIITQRFGVVDEQLDTECSDEDLQHFGRHLVGYIKYANALGLLQADIAQINFNGNKEIADNIKLKLTEALKKWKSVCKFSKPLATYRSLLRVAIKLEDGDGAEEICKQIKRSVSCNKSASPDSFHTTPAANSESQQFSYPVIDCGCKKCSVFDYISGKKYSSPKQLPFPRFEISKFTKEENEYMKREWGRQTVDIHRKFSTLVMKTCIELSEKLGNFKMLKSFLKLLLIPTLNSEQASQMNDLDQLDLSDIPEHLLNKYYCSWFDYDLIESLRKYVYPDEDEALASYKELLKCYVSQRCFFNLNITGSWPEGHVKVTCKFDEKYNELSQDLVERVKDIIVRTIEVCPFHLSFMWAQEGCIELIFAAFPYFSEISLSKYQMAQLKKYGFIKITVNEKELIQSEVSDEKNITGELSSVDKDSDEHFSTAEDFIPLKKELGPDNLEEVFTAITSAQRKWYIIGLLLCIPTYTLFGIKYNQQTTSDCCRDMLEVWLKGNFASWQFLVTVLESPIVKEAGLAGQLKRKYLLQTSSQSGVRDDQGRSPFNTATKNTWDIERALYLIKLGCGSDKNKCKLLCKACDQGKLDVVKELVEQHNVDPNGVRDNQQRSLVDIALASRSLSVALYLIDHGCGSDEDKGKLLCEACHRGELDVMKELVEQHNIDPNGVQDDQERSPLDIALDSWSLSVPLYLINHGYGSDEDKGKLLCKACHQGKLDVVKELVEQHNVDPNGVRDDQGRSLVDIALASWSLSVALYLINYGYDCSDEDKGKLLCKACHWGELDVIKELVEQHSVDPNGLQDDQGRSPVDIALTSQSFSVPIYLINHGCGSDEDKGKLLCEASHQGKLNMVKELVEQHNVDPNGVRDDQGRSPVKIALARRFLSVALYLINHGCDRGEDKGKLLCEACLQGKLDVVKELVELHNVDPNGVQDDQGRSLLDITLASWSLNVAFYLINHGCKCSDEDKGKLLCKACHWGELDMVKKLVEQHNVDPNGVRDDQGRSSVDIALASQSLSVALYLVNHGCGSDENKGKLLCKACHQDKMDVVKELVEQHNVDPIGTRDYRGRSLVDSVLNNVGVYRHPNCQLVLYLINHGCDCSDEDKGKLLSEACHQGELDVVKELVEQHSVDPKGVRDDQGKSPVDIALVRQFLSVALYLINHGCDSDENKGKLLCLACHQGKLDVVKELVEQHNIDSNGLRDEQGRSPVDIALAGFYVCFPLYLINHGCGSDEDKGKLLCKACHQGKLDVVKELVEQHNVDPNGVQDDQGRSPVDIALSSWHINVPLYLINHGCGSDKDKGKLLCKACDQGELDVVKELVEQHNVDPNGVTDEMGWRPVDIAELMSNTGVFTYLKSLSQKYSDSDPPLSEEDSDALHILLQRAKVTLPYSSYQLSFKKVQQLLHERGYKDLAINLKTELNKVIQQQQHYLKSLEDLMTDRGTIDLCFRKVFLVGPPGVGKTTTLNRLLKVFINISLGGDKARLQSSLLVNCIQIFAFVSSDATRWISSSDLDKEVVLLFQYMCGFKLEIGMIQYSSKMLEERKAILESKQSDIKIRVKSDKHVSENERSKHSDISVKSDEHVNRNKPDCSYDFSMPVVDARKSLAVQTRAQHDRIHTFIGRLQKVIKNEVHADLMNLMGSTLLNLNDIGGQPGFLEMLPALSSGPAMYLVFLDLSKELDKPYKIPFNRTDTVITPYDAIYTVKDTISQILSAVNSVHYTPSSNKASKFGEKFKRFQEIQPVAALVGTHKDKLVEPVEHTLENINKTLKTVTEDYSKLIVNPSPTSTLFAVDNFTGTEASDIGPLRKLISGIFQTHFKQSSLPIRPNWLWLSLILRREYKIVTRYDCLEFAQSLDMDEDEVDFVLWYLHSCTGTLLYYPDIPDEWFQNHIICSPQVVFDSISQLVVVSLRVLHSESFVIEEKRAEFIKKGQFSIESIEEYCTSETVKEQLKKNELIPTKQLVTLLQYVNLLSPITHTEDDGSKRTTYLMPAILECASPEELNTPHPTNTDNPEPLFLTFKCGFVPTGSFCGLVTRLVSIGPEQIFGLTWELVEDNIKRNRVSFYVNHFSTVTLISHSRCFELLINRIDPDTDLHGLCTHVLSVVLYILNNLYKNLNPQIAFRCPCPKHSTDRGVDNLCTFVEVQPSMKFSCEKKSITPTRRQTIWFGKSTNIGAFVKLEVLKYADCANFSFHWTKIGSRHQVKTTSEPNTLMFPSVGEKDLGYYRCEVREAGRVVLTVYRALYREEATEEQMDLAEEPLLEGVITQSSSMTGSYRTQAEEKLVKTYAVSKNEEEEYFSCEEDGQSIVSASAPHQKTKNEDQPAPHQKTKNEDQPAPHQKTKNEDQPVPHQKTKNEDQPASHQKTKNEDQLRKLNSIQQQQPSTAIPREESGNQRVHKNLFRRELEPVKKAKFDHYKAQLKKSVQCQARVPPRPKCKEFIEVCRAGELDRLIDVCLQHLGIQEGKTAVELRAVALEEAYKRDISYISHLVIESGINLDERDTEVGGGNFSWLEVGGSPLYWASRYGHTEIVRILIACGASLNIQTVAGHTPLWTSSFEGHTMVVKLLIDAGAEVDTQSEDGLTALYVSCSNGHGNTAQLLIEAGAFQDVQGSDGFSALMIASQKGHHQVVDILVKAKANLNLQAENGFSALMVASQNGRNQVVKILVEAEADLNLQTTAGSTALIMASQNGHKSTVQLLIKAGASLDAQKNTGATALYKACQNGHPLTAQVLIDAGAFLDAQVKDGRTALDVATQSHGPDSEVVTVLTIAGARPGNR